MKQSLSQVYERAAKIIGSPHSFCRSRPAERPSRVANMPPESCLPTDPEATAWNAGGAIYKVARNSEEARVAFIAFRDTVCEGRALAIWATEIGHAGQVSALQRMAEAA